MQQYGIICNSMESYEENPNIDDEWMVHESLKSHINVAFKALENSIYTYEYISWLFKTMRSLEPNEPWICPLLLSIYNRQNYLFFWNALFGVCVAYTTRVRFTIRWLVMLIEFEICKNVWILSFFLVYNWWLISKYEKKIKTTNRIRLRLTKHY